MQDADGVLRGRDGLPLNRETENNNALTASAAACFLPCFFSPVADWLMLVYPLCQGAGGCSLYNGGFVGYLPTGVWHLVVFLFLIGFGVSIGSSGMIVVAVICLIGAITCVVVGSVSLFRINRLPSRISVAPAVDIVSVAIVPVVFSPRPQGEIQHNSQAEGTYAGSYPQQHHIPVGSITPGYYVPGAPVAGSVTPGYQPPGYQPYPQPPLGAPYGHDPRASFPQQQQQYYPPQPAFTPPHAPVGLQMGVAISPPQQPAPAHPSNSGGALREESRGSLREESIPKSKTVDLIGEDV